MSFFCIGSALGLDKRVAFTRESNGLCTSDVRRFPYEWIKKYTALGH